MTRKLLRVVMAAIACITTSQGFSAYAEVLTLKSAEQYALENDPRVNKAIADTEAAMADSQASGQLPDPRVKVAAMNLPLDTFDLDQEAMTNLQLGIQQSFPAGSTLDLEKSTSRVRTMVREFETETLKKKVLREVRGEWLKAWSGQAKTILLSKQRQVLEALLPSVKGAYRVGRGKQSDVSRIRLRIAQLEEEYFQLQGELDTGLAGLGRWGFGSVLRLPQELPNALKTMPTGKLETHPEVDAVTSRAEISRYQIDIAEQHYKPAWGVEASYGWRDDRTDLLTLGISLSLPLFAEKSLDARLAARQKDYQAARESVQNIKIELETKQRRLERKLESLTHRVNSYQTEILPELKTLQTLARTEYRSGRADFSRMLEAEEAFIKAQRNLLNLQIEKAVNIIELRYLLEEVQS